MTLLIFANFEQVIIFNSYFADFEQAIIFLVVILLTLNNNYRSINFLVIAFFILYKEKNKTFL